MRCISEVLLGTALSVVVSFAFAQSPGSKVGTCRDSPLYRGADNHIYWLEGDDLIRVYAQGHTLVGVAQCGDGVIAWFNTPVHTVAYYSADCLHLGDPGGNTSQVHIGQPIASVRPRTEGVRTRFADGQIWDSPNCLSIGARPSVKVQ